MRAHAPKVVDHVQREIVDGKIERIVAIRLVDAERRRDGGQHEFEKVEHAKGARRRHFADELVADHVDAETAAVHCAHVAAVLVDQLIENAGIAEVVSGAGVEHKRKDKSGERRHV